MSANPSADLNRITATAENFAAEVLEKSRHAPVLVDFWAPWCAPCRQLMPILDRLAEEYAGGLILAKINTDEEQQLAVQLGIRSLPTVALFKDGKVVTQFVGAIPEAQVRQRLQPHLPAAA